MTCGFEAGWSALGAVNPLPYNKWAQGLHTLLPLCEAPLPHNSITVTPRTHLTMLVRHQHPPGGLHKAEAHVLQANPHQLPSQHHYTGNTSPMENSVDSLKPFTTLEN